MKASSYIASLLVAILLLTGCSGLVIFGKNVQSVKPSNVVITETRPVSKFTGIDMRTFGKVVLSQGDSESLTVKGSDNVVPLIKTTVRDGVLVVETEENIDIIGMNKENVLTFTIVAKDLSSITVSGTAEVEMPSLSTSSLDVTMSGAGSITLGKLTAEVLNVNLSGVGSVEIAGDAASAKIDISGAGGIQAPDLKVKTANATISGIGGATLWVTDQLTGEISGGGDVSYYGNPQTNTKTTGVGNFKSLGSK